jgi:hypothetical protein
MRPVSDHQASGREMLQRTAKSCGPDAPTLASSFAEGVSAQPGLDKTYPQATVAKEPGHRGEPDISRKTIACGNAGRFRCTRCCSCAFYHYKVHTRPRVQRAPGIPHALLWAEDTCTTRTNCAARSRSRGCEPSGCLKSEAGVCEAPPLACADLSDAVHAKDLSPQARREILIAHVAARQVTRSRID